jgi:hypothetical protein
LSPETERGFVYHQPASAKFGIAVIISFLQSCLAVTSGNKSFYSELISFFFEVPVIMIGFYFGPWLLRLVERRDEILGKVDKIESGEISLSEELRAASGRASGSIRELFNAPESKPQPAPVTAPEPSPPAPESPAPEELMAGYLHTGSKKDQ